VDPQLSAKQFTCAGSLTSLLILVTKLAVWHCIVNDCEHLTRLHVSDFSAKCNSVSFDGFDTESLA